MANRDLQFVLRFKSEATGVLTAARQEMQKLAQQAVATHKALQALNVQANTFKTNLATGTNAAQAAANAQQKLTVQSQRLAIETQRLNQQQQSLALNEQRLALAQERLTLQQRRHGEQLRRQTGGVHSFSGALLGATRAFLPLTAAVAAYGSINLADDFNLLRGRIQLSTESAAEFAQVFDRLRSTAKTTGVDLGVTVDIFQRLAQVRKEIRASAEEMTQFTDTVAKLGVVSGASPDALKFGLTQLGQSLSSNLVRAEEFNSIMENIPAVGKAIADELGVTTGQLRLLVINGKLASEDAFAALLNATKKVNGQFEQMPMTVGRAFKGLLIDLQNGIALMDGAVRGTDALVWVLQKAGSTFKVISIAVKTFATLVESVFIALATLLNKFWSDLLIQSQDFLNGFVQALNSLKPGEEIKLFSFAPIPDNRFSLAAADMLKERLNSLAADAKAADAELAILFGKKQQSNIKEADLATREITKNYAELVKALQNADKLSEGERKRAAFLADVKDQIAQLQEETRWIGRSNKERERAVALLKLQQDAISAGIKDFNPAAYLKAYDALQAAKERIHTDSATGLNTAAQEMKNNMQGAGDLAADVFNKGTEGISSVLSDFVSGSLNSFDDLRKGIGSILSDIAGQIAKFVIQQQLIKPLLDSIFGSSGPSSGGLVMGGLLSNAHGNAFAEGRVAMFAKGGVVNQATAFPMRGGTGVMGEAGPEAVMPLRRLSNGDLGVQYMGGSGGATQLNYSPNFNFQLDGGSQQGGMDRTASDALYKQLDNEVQKTVLAVIQREQRPGGSLAGGRGRTV